MDQKFSPILHLKLLHSSFSNIPSDITICNHLAKFPLVFSVIFFVVIRLFTESEFSTIVTFYDLPLFSRLPLLYYPNTGMHLLLLSIYQRPVMFGQFLQYGKLQFSQWLSFLFINFLFYAFNICLFIKKFLVYVFLIFSYHCYVISKSKLTDYLPTNTGTFKVFVPALTRSLLNIASWCLFLVELKLFKKHVLCVLLISVLKVMWV